MGTGSFTAAQYISMLAAVSSLMISLVFNYSGKEKISVLTLLLFAFFLNSFMASLDPFLNIWDERFHALVAKNMMNHPFKPTLYDNPVIDIPYNNWDRYHVWLHKQPLFLWQIMISFKIFGVNEFTLRIPNILLGTILVIISYRTGKLVVNSRTGYLAGLLIITCYFILNLLAGRQAVDHCDFSFLVYTSLSIWALVEYKNSPHWKWIVLTGIFAGFAVLCKWLVGLLVYFGWFVINIQEKGFRKIFSRDLMLSFLVTLLVALPWQIYIFIAFPQEAKMTYLFNIRHLTEPLDGQGGSFLFHLNRFDLLYGSLSSFLIVPAFFILLKTSVMKKPAVALTATAILIYLVFSFSTTKMPAYAIIASLPVFIAFGTLLDYTGKPISRLIVPDFLKSFLFFLLVSLFILIRFDFASFKDHHASWDDENSYSSMLYHNRQIFKNLDLPANTVIFNVRGQHFIESMFYTGLPSYSIMPNEEQYRFLKENNYRLAVFRPVQGEIPGWLLSDPDVIIIDKILKGY